MPGKKHGRNDKMDIEIVKQKLRDDKLREKLQKQYEDDLKKSRIPVKAKL
jgi:hypothetical protein